MKPFLSNLTAAALIGLASPAFAHGGAHPEASMSPVEIVTAFQAKVKPLWDKYTPKIGKELIEQALATK